ALGHDGVRPAQLAFRVPLTSVIAISAIGLEANIKSGARERELKPIGAWLIQSDWIGRHPQPPSPCRLVRKNPKRVSCLGFFFCGEDERWQFFASRWPRALPLVGRQSKAPNCDDRHLRCQRSGIIRTYDNSIPQVQSAFSGGE